MVQKGIARAIEGKQHKHRYAIGSDQQGEYLCLEVEHNQAKYQREEETVRDKQPSESFQGTGLR